MPRPRHQEIIALCEDPRETFDDISSHPATAERLEEIARLADSLFSQGSPEDQVWDTMHLPLHISAERLSRLSEPQRSDILAQLPTDLAEQLIDILPVSIS